MSFEEKKRKYEEVSKGMVRDLKPIFDRLIEKQSESLDEVSDTNWEEVIPPLRNNHAKYPNDGRANSKC